MKSYHYFILINILGFAFAIALSHYVPGKEILAGIIAATITGSFSYINYTISNDRLFKEIFTECNNKYDDKFNQVLNNITDDTTFEELDKDKLNDYLNLSAEEFLWYKKDRIPKDVWLAWEVGILFHLKKPAIKQFVKNEIKQRESYYGLFEKSAFAKVLADELPV